MIKYDEGHLEVTETGRAIIKKSKNVAPKQPSQPKVVQPTRKELYDLMLEIKDLLTGGTN